MSEDPPYFSLKELYRLRRSSLTQMVNDCYERLLGDPAINILTDSYIIAQHKMQSIQRIVETLIDSESQLMVAKLTTEEELLKSQIRILKDRLNHYMMEAEIKTPREQVDTVKKKLNNMIEEKREQEQEIRNLLEQHGFEFVNSTKYSLQRVLNEYDFARRGVITREQLIKRLYKEIGELRRSDVEEPDISQKKSAYHDNSDRDSSVSRLRQTEIEQLKSQIDRLNGVIKGFTQTRNSTHQLLQKKIEDSEHKNERDIRLLRQNESKLRLQVQSKLNELEQSNMLLGKRLEQFQKENNELKDDNAVMGIQLNQANQNKQHFEARLRQLEENFESMRVETEVLEFQNRNTRTQADKHKQQEDQTRKQLKLSQQQTQESRHVAEQQKSQIDSILQLHKQQLNKKGEEYRASLDTLVKENHELRQKVMTSMAELQLARNQAVSKSKRTNEDGQLYRQSTYVQEMERLCNERVEQFEKELEEKNQSIVALTKEKIQNRRKVEDLEGRLSQYQRVRNEHQHSFSSMSNNVDIITQALTFERKMHLQQSQTIRKITAKFSNQILQLKELLKQKQSIIKSCYKYGSNGVSLKNAKTLLLLKEQISKIASQYRCLQYMVKSQLKAVAEFYQMLLNQSSFQSEDSKELDRNYKTKKKTATQSCLRKQFIDSRDRQLELLSLRVAQDEQYIHHLNKLLTSEDSD